MLPQGSLMKIYQDNRSWRIRHGCFINHGRVLKAAGSFSRIQMRINQYTILQFIKFTKYILYDEFNAPVKSRI